MPHLLRPLFLTLLLLALIPPMVAGEQEDHASAGLNPHIMFPLHATASGNPCSVSPVDCLGHHPTVNVPPNTTTTIYLMAIAYSALAGVQTAFEWDPGWGFLGAYFDCLPGQLTTTTPAAPGGSDAGTVTTVFDCMQSTQLVTIGRLVMMAGSSGCLRQVVSSHQNGTHAVDCLNGVDVISESSRLGRICVTAGGEITCGLDADPVEPTTWGQVKATYR